MRGDIVCGARARNQSNTRGVRYKLRNPKYRRVFVCNNTRTSCVCNNRPRYTYEIRLGVPRRHNRPVRLRSRAVFFSIREIVVFGRPRQRTFSFFFSFFHFPDNNICVCFKRRVARVCVKPLRKNNRNAVWREKRDPPPKTFFLFFSKRISPILSPEYDRNTSFVVSSGHARWWFVHSHVSIQ